MCSLNTSFSSSITPRFFLSDFTCSILSVFEPDVIVYGWVGWFLPTLMCLHFLVLKSMFHICAQFSELLTTSSWTSLIESWTSLIEEYNFPSSANNFLISAQYSRKIVYKDEKEHRARDTALRNPAHNCYPVWASASDNYSLSSISEEILYPLK